MAEEHNSAKQSTRKAEGTQDSEVAGQRRELDDEGENSLGRLDDAKLKDLANSSSCLRVGE